MKAKEASSPSTPIFRIRVLDAVIDVPFKHHHMIEGPIIGDAGGPALSQQPEHSPSSPNNNSILNTTTTITTTNNINHAISPPPSSPRTNRSQGEFLALLILLPAQRYSSSPTPSFDSADYFDCEGDVGRYERRLP
ncbi:hypothetical protein F4813DRAFT_348510 [Daldinia decipiens]|uniref:uncharacterized protein n=1 Tax=Daldinia decipiens TaxID=326647 RepID=UPI0020C29AE9|nr:uncharacterized protein F4813DRAFT_348510 [Daldinia decipiens]KAI1660837.1 hypothetical protein F4813DRAFT_348510 [Daldinia decipiens]